MKKSFWLIALGVLLTLHLSAQRDETLFSKLRITGAWGGSATNFTQLGSDYATLTGGYGGLEFSKDFFVGWGAFSTVGNFFIDDLTNDRYRMSYNGLILGYSPKAYKALHLQANLLAGGGTVHNRETLEEDQFIAIQPFIGVELNVLRWFRVGIGGGYRALLDTDLPNISSSDLSGGYGEVRFKFGWSWGKKNYD